jgi:hypothetical protein
MTIQSKLWLSLIDYQIPHKLYQLLFFYMNILSNLVIWKKNL